ncbi:threonine--tRNA ligase [Caedibacter taeniospiralis]|jgi:threonyl-tRNA synthetase|uniref:threonine--tRNA ligase n=1 Tax=Caedibacter taeniospiralis TaxID=28907 RepID=UPI0037C0064F
MPVITLPDGSKRVFDKPVSVYTVALDVGAGLAKATLAGVVNGVDVDTSFVINDDTTLTLITAKDTKGLEILRHSCAHLLAQAVKQLYPKAQVTIGPVIEDGFFYDFSYERAFTPEDLEKIEARMYELANLAQQVERSVKSRVDAITYFEAIGENYKAEIIKDLPESETLSLYSQGDFTDLCRGPHVPNTSHLKAFKLMRVAGAYWRGDSKNEMLTRIYGTCWTDNKQLKDYLTRLEEAEKRDHRKIGKTMDLFHLQEEAPGMVFWHPKGWVIWQTVEQYMRSMFVKYGYQEVKTPQIVDRSLWEKSGHWEKFHEDMYSLEVDNRQYAIKPMNCPCHVQIYKQGITSYRNLPLRLAEFGSCHRNEASGALHGIMRTRNFVQDDAHIFCMESQIQSEVMHFIDMLFEVYTRFGLADIAVKLSTRPEKRIGADEVWEKAEKALADALDAKGLDWKVMPGEGAFYGPKIEFEIKDCLSRSWTTGSVQLDFSMPVRLNAEYVDEDGSKKHPVMLHRAICGSLERFIGILIEHYAGKLPVWLAPVQVVLTGISNKQDQYLQEVERNLRKLGVRTQIDLRNEKIGFKIREHTLSRVPFIVIAGEKEQSLGQITVRKQDGTDLGALSIDALTGLLLAEIEKKVE